MQISINNDYSHLITQDTVLKKKLQMLLKVRAKGYFHSPAYKNGYWDGFVHFFNENGKFLTGLLPEIIYALKGFNETYEIIDNRKKFNWIHEQIDENFLNQFNPDEKINLRDFQYDLVNQVLKYNRGVIQAPTGSGKTFCLISILKCMPPKTPTLFLAKNASLVDQNYQEMKKWGVENLGRWYGKYKEPNFTMCATINKQTFISLEKLLPKFKALIVDEIHESGMSAVPKKAFKMMKEASVRVAISATPFKNDGKDKEQKFDVKGYFGPIFKTKTTESGLLTTKELQDKKILSKSIGTFHFVNHPNNLYHEPYIDAVTYGIAKNYEFLDMVRRLAKSLSGRTLIMVERVEQGEILKTMLPDAHWIYGKDTIKKRLPVFEELRSKETCVAIVMQQIITAGINVFIHNLINASGGKAHHSIVQRIGRGLRTADDKELLYYYDWIFKSNPYLEEHSYNRINIMKKEGHEVVIKNDFNY